MIDNGHIHHDNLGMGTISIILSVLGAVTVTELTGHAIHWLSIIFGAVLVFLVQKAMHYFWDKHFTKK